MELVMVIMLTEIRQAQEDKYQMILLLKKKQTTETGVWKNQDQNQKPADPTGVTSRMVVTRGLEGKWRARDEERLTDSYQATDRWELLAIFTIKKC